MATLDFDEIGKFMKESFQPERSKEIDFSVQIEINDIEDGIWHLQIKDQNCQVEKGGLISENAKLSVGQADLLNLLAGHLNPTFAFFTGRIKLSGDQSGLLKMISLFDFNKKSSIIY
jgi:putative sterol carrier protein